eukprot:CAMPEP_0118929592 /NCGR_PEP_ID=MMETSP1169-20130426/6545_1 /TAXON_ID=36882 /ORGANISM="Pyramimonas obovata, Strain CCMP722" /LENGTH=269 /DNA_ID=CAMNT_0006871811 /DNA_START=260 /DNA_END=1067 /DNA_ORIENTATION=-
MVSPSDFRVLYFDAPTRGEQIRLLFVITGTPFEDVRFKFPGGIKPFKQATMGDDSPLAFDQVPCVEHNGIAIAQTSACMHYVGSQLGLAPGTPGGDSLAMSITMGAEEARNAVFYGTLIPVVLLKYIMGLRLARALTGWWRKKRYHKWMGFFERQLRITSAAAATVSELHFVDHKLSYADVAVFDMVQGTLDVGAYTGADLAKDFPLLHRFVGQMRDLPNLEAYLEERGPVLDASGSEAAQARHHGAERGEARRFWSPQLAIATHAATQ